MTKYLITWNVGYGEEHAVGNFSSEDEALDDAYENWKQDAEGNADYDAVLLTPELAEKYCVEDELDD
jgi:hypothetical protein